MTAEKSTRVIKATNPLTLFISFSPSFEPPHLTLSPSLGEEEEGGGAAVTLVATAPHCVLSGSFALLLFQIKILDEPVMLFNFHVEILLRLLNPHDLGYETGLLHLGLKFRLRDGV
jgi:hypothetical protein